MIRLALLLVLTLPLVTQGCLLDIAPAREPFDEAWIARMLAGEYGHSTEGVRTPPVGNDRLESSPGGAHITAYGIGFSEQSDLGGGGWSIIGGMVARVVRPHENVELFGKQIARTHGFLRTSGDKDMSFEFFLVLRPHATGRGRLIKRWSFAYEDLGRVVPPALERNLRARYAGVELENELARSKGIFVDGYLDFDEPSRTATVTITGLVRPFQEPVDLSQEIGRAASRTPANMNDARRPVYRLG
jgi:hypothetical protein